MVSLDSVKLEIPVEFLKFYKEDSFYNKVISDNEKNFKFSDDDILKDDKKIVGLKTIEIKKLHKVIHIETSGKILKKKYYEGLTINTIDEYFDLINATNLIVIDKKAIDYAKVLRCDVVNNLKVSNNINKYLNSLSLCAFNHNYLVSNYAGGVVFTKQVKSYKRRMIFYDKYKEIKKDKEVSKLLRLKDIEIFKNVLRCEQNLTSFKTIRQAFKVDDIKLIDILQSKEKINYNTFNEITNERSLTMYDFKSFKDVERFFVAYMLCQDFNYDFKEIKNFLMHYLSKSQTYKKLKMIKEYAKRLDKLKKINEQIEEIRELLKAS
jgi:hypothetical protein